MNTEELQKELAQHKIIIDALISLVRQIKHERDMLRKLTSVFLDTPEDRMYHAKDKTWWKRVGDELKSADPPIL